MYEVFIYCGKYVIDPSWVTVSTLGHIVSNRLRESRHLPCKLKQNEIRHFFFGLGLIWKLSKVVNGTTQGMSCMVKLGNRVKN